jgi:hypothetical protein
VTYFRLRIRRRDTDSARCLASNLLEHWNILRCVASNVAMRAVGRLIFATFSGIKS